jgi:hypothetical protein
MQLFHRSRKGETGLALLGGLGLGALLMYVLDPERGARRRALARDKAVRLYNRTSDRVGARSRDLRNRTKGAAAKTRSLLQSDDIVSDDVLAERVRSRIGRSVSHPGALDVSARGGRIRLAGPVLEREVEDLIDTVRSTPGVAEVEDLLEVHEHADAVPALQGTPRSDRQTS